MDKNNLTPEDEEVIQRTSRLIDEMIKLTDDHDFIEVAAALSAVFGFAIFATDQEKDFESLMKRFAFCARTSIKAHKNEQALMTPNENFSGWQKLSKMWIRK